MPDAERLLMVSQIVHIKRSNGRLLDAVEVQLGIGEPTWGRHYWGGEFIARSTEGFRPSERITLTLANGQAGIAEIRQTEFASRTPETTLVQFVGAGPLSDAPGPG
jgi:hypothetical protein